MVARTPSVAYGASSLAEGAFLTVSSLAFNLLSPYRQSLFRATPLWRGFRYTTKNPPIGGSFHKTKMAESVGQKLNFQFKAQVFCCVSHLSSPWGAIAV